jgi:hypothetical protein
MAPNPEKKLAPEKEHAEKEEKPAEKEAKEKALPTGEASSTETPDLSAAAQPRAMGIMNSFINDIFERN